MSIKPGYKEKVISPEDFFDERDEEWLDARIKDCVKMMSA